MTTTAFSATPTAAGGWIVAAPFRAYLRHLIAASGVPWRVIATLAGLPPQSVQSLLSGRNGRPVQRISPDLGLRLYAITEATLHETRYRQVPAGATRQRLLGLVEAGWPPAELSRRLGIGAGGLEGLLSGRVESCPQLVSLQVKAARAALLRDAA